MWETTYIRMYTKPGLNIRENAFTARNTVVPRGPERSTDPDGLYPRSNSLSLRPASVVQSNITMIS